MHTSSTTDGPGSSIGAPRLGDSIRASRVLVVGLMGAALVAVSISAQTYLSMLNHGHSFWRILSWQLTSWSFWGLAAAPVLRLSARRSGTKYSRLGQPLTLLALGMICIASHLAIAAQLTVWFQPYVPRVEYDYRQAFVEQFGSQFVTDALAFAVLLLVARGRLLALREARLEAELTRAHLETLRLEIQPHFLFNTLNSVAALIRLKANDKALDMLLKLSELMRRTLDRPAGHLVALGDEVDFVKRYIDLHRSRFSDRLDVTYSVDSDCQDVAVPPFLLQPLVENALRHGMAKHAGPCRLELGARFNRDLVLVWVADDGAGLPAGFDIARDAGTGLSNIRRRLDELYGPSATLGIRPAERAGTVVDIAVPRTFVNRLERAAG